MERDPVDAVERRLARERKARREAEAIAERVTGELYAAVEKLERTNRELADANQSIREFVAVASHDLKNPLTSILGFAELLRDQAQSSSSPDQLAMLDIILKQSGRMQRLVQDLLLLSQLEAGALQPQLTEICVAEELVRYAEILGPDGSGIAVDAERALVVRADPHHMERIIGNYLTNALKYGGPPIRMEAVPAREFVAVRVCDYGQGIPDEFVARLFSKFARAADAATSDRLGSGLGLSIVRGLALANGGEAWYEPNRPFGSVFAVRLPAA
jgi:signal transduction histidine kinase